MERFLKDIKRYYKYGIYSGKSELKSDIANSHLGWLWWVLDPLLFMLVYTFIALIVFGKGEDYFPVYVFVGLTCWQFFERTVKQSVKLVSSNSAIVTKVYIPKFILVAVKIYANGFKMVVSFALVFIMMLIFRVPLSWKIIFAIPSILTLGIFTFGASCILLHFGVFLEDLSNIINVLLKLVFYLSGIFYSLSRVPYPFDIMLLNMNPIALLIDNMRKSLIYNSYPNFGMIGLWILISLILAIIGVKIIYKYENSYVKVI